MPKSIHRVEYDRMRELLRDARVRRGVRQADLAAQLDKAQNFVSNVERGVRRIDVIELRDWCRALGTDLVDFCEALERQVPPQVTARRRPARAKPKGRAVPKARR